MAFFYFQHAMNNSCNNYWLGAVVCLEKCKIDTVALVFKQTTVTNLPYPTQAIAIVSTMRIVLAPTDTVFATQQ